jgi:hypothetical protein
VFAETKSLYGPIVRGVDHQVKSAEALDGDDLPVTNGIGCREQGIMATLEAAFALMSGDLEGSLARIPDGIRIGR